MVGELEPPTGFEPAQPGFAIRSLIQFGYGGLKYQLMIFIVMDILHLFGVTSQCCTILKSVRLSALYPNMFCIQSDQLTLHYLWQQNLHDHYMIP